MVLEFLKCCIIPYRREKYILTFVLAFALIFQYSLRGIMDCNVEAYIQGSNKTTFPHTNVNRNQFIRVAEQISTVLSFPICGIIADLYGGKFVLLTGVCVNVCLSILFPIAIQRWPWWTVAIMLFSIGLGQALVTTPIASILSYWIRNDDMSYHLSLVHSGGFLGTLVMFVINNMANQTAERVFTIQCIYTAYGFMTFVLVLLTVFSTPWKHPCMATKTKKILENVAGDKFPKKVRWREIVRDPAIWSICIGILGYKWMFRMVFANLERIYGGFDNEQRRTIPLYWYVQFPAIVGYVGTWCGGIATTRVIKSRKIPFLYIRTVNNIIAGPVCCILALVANAIKSNIYLEISALLLSMFCLGVGFCGSHANITDITRHYAGTVLGMANSIQYTIVFISFIANTYVGDEVLKRYKWDYLVWLSFFVCLVSVVLSFVWLESELRPWDQIVIEEYEEEYEEEEY